MNKQDVLARPYESLPSPCSGLLIYLSLTTIALTGGVWVVSAMEFKSFRLDLLPFILVAALVVVLGIMVWVAKGLVRDFKQLRADEFQLNEIAKGTWALWLVPKEQRAELWRRNQERLLRAQRERELKEASEVLTQALQQPFEDMRGKPLMDALARVTDSISKFTDDDVMIRSVDRYLWIEAYEAIVRTLLYRHAARIGVLWTDVTSVATAVVDKPNEFVENMAEEMRDVARRYDVSWNGGYTPNVNHHLDELWRKLLKAIEDHKELVEPY